MSRLRALTVAAVVVSMIGASTSAIAAAPTGARVSTSATTAAGSWGTLSMMTGSSAATAAIRADDDDRGGFGHPALLSLAVILGTLALAIYIITKKRDKDIEFTPVPISPN